VTAASQSGSAAARLETVMRLQNKIAIVVGAGQGPGTGMGNGRATVIRFAQEAWGHNHRNQCNVPADLTDVVSIAAHGFMSYALKKDGTVASWGTPGND
jgi:NAD(P)-dependent dehydrogenase (short-subunit alcohol dehydrogenase family)